LTILTSLVVPQYATDRGLLNLVKLEFLELDHGNSDISDVSLIRLTNLSYLSVQDNDHVTNRTIEVLTNLKSLSVYDTLDITKECVLENMKHLDYFNYDGLRVKCSYDMKNCERISHIQACRYRRY
jgi:hypothetical protein